MVDVKSHRLSARHIARVVCADLIGRNTEIDGSDIQVDSRKCRKGSAFVPLAGENTDGHFFVKSAVENGSALCFVHRRFFDENEALLLSVAKKNDATYLLVDDCLKALQTLAADHVRREADRGLVVVGITGSNGKTTTKEILGSILANHTTEMVSPGNLNSEIGLPLAALGIREEHRVAVLEMGINRRGEMRTLADIARPALAAVTNIAMAHVGLLGSQQAIADEKAQIFRHVDENGWGFLREDEPYRDVLAKHCRGGIEFFGPRSTVGYEGSDALGLEGSRLRWNRRTVTLPLIGKYNVLNALCAISLAQKLGVPDDAIAQGLEDVEPLFGRGQVFSGEVTVIQDCYNANTDSMIKAMEFVGSLPWTGRKILVLGSMKELGTDSDNEHRLVGDCAADSDADAVFFYGEESAAAYNAARQKAKTGGDRFTWTESFEKLEGSVSSLVRPGDLVLLKGSRGVELERLGGSLIDQG